MDDKTEQSVYWLNLAYKSLQQREPDGKLYIAYSGGKDSECIADLCMTHLPKDAFEINYNATGIDPPEVVKHIKARFRAWEANGIECHFNKPSANMHDLIVKKGPPTRLKRYCCEYFKESASDGRVTITGVRWAESSRRKDGHDVVTVYASKRENRARYHTDNDVETQIMEQCRMRGRLTVNPIIHWTDDDVWQYIRECEIIYCTLYDEGFKRLGCIGCPLAGTKTMKQEFLRWPHMERYYRRAIAAFLARNPEKYALKHGWRTVDDVWHWWIQDGIAPGQVTMDEYLDSRPERAERIGMEG